MDSAQLRALRRISREQDVTGVDVETLSRLLAKGHVETKRVPRYATEKPGDAAEYKTIYLLTDKGEQALDAA